MANQKDATLDGPLRSVLEVEYIRRTLSSKNNVEKLFVLKKKKRVKNLSIVLTVFIVKGSEFFVDIDLCSYPESLPIISWSRLNSMLMAPKVSYLK